MKCKECGTSLKGDLALECEACGMFPFDCSCASSLGRTPPRYVHCFACDRKNICRVNTSERGWRSGEV